MKKSIMLLVVALMAMTLHAQITIKPQLNAGDVFNYHNESTISLSSPQTGVSMKDTKMASDTRITVKSATKDSVVLEQVITNVDIPQEFTIEGGGSSFTQNVGNLKALVGKPVLFSATTDGKPLHVLNLATLKQAMLDYLKSVPELSGGKALDPNVFVENIANDKTMLESVDQAGIYSFFGKTIKTGDTDDFNIEGIKAKRTYTVSDDGKQISVTYTPNMTSEDVKQMIISQLKMAGQEAYVSQFEASWPMVEASGMAKVDLSGTMTMQIGDKGWASTIDGNTTVNAMGMVMKSVNKTVLK